MPDATLYLPLAAGGAYAENLPFGNRVPLSALVPHLEQGGMLGELPSWGTAHLLFRDPLLPDNRTLLFSLSFCLTNKALNFYMTSGTGFRSPTAAVMALTHAPSFPTTFWLQIRKPIFFRDIDTWTINEVPLRIPFLSPFPVK